MKWLLLFTCLHFYCIAIAQTVMTVDRTQVLIGDQVKATITTNLTEGREWRNLEEVWPDSIPGIEVVNGPVVDSKNPASARYTWTLAVFDTGFVSIPALPVVIRQGNQLDTSMTTEIPIEVMKVEPDSSGLIGIKNIEKQPFSIWYYKRYWPHILVGLLLLAGLYYWWRKRQRRAEVVPEPEPEPLPHEWALKALDELEEKKLWQQGEIKEHYTVLTGIFRSYLERRYGIKALEQTSDEILRQLNFQHIGNEMMQDTEQLLSVADLIKFAKADPGMDVHAAAIERVRKFVRETLFIPAPEATNDLNTQHETVE